MPGPCVRWGGDPNNVGRMILGWSKKRRASLSEDIDLLLADLCTEWGFCNALRGEELVSRIAVLTPEVFAFEVLTAEGMIPEYEPEWRRKMRAKFAERYGQAVSVKTYGVMPE